MVKRTRHEDLAGALEFEGRTAEDPEFITWLTEHRARKGGKIRVAQGGKGVRVMFSNAADAEGAARHMTFVTSLFGTAADAEFAARSLIE